MNFRYFSVALATALCFISSATAQNTANIQGTVVDSVTGKAVVGAIIAATNSAPPALTKTATSSFDGTFQISSLPAGNYNVCVQTPRGGYLNSCHWGDVPATIAVATGKKSAGTTLKLKPGHVLRVHMDDPAHLLDRKTKDGHSPDLLMGVWSSGTFYPARLAGVGMGAVEYQVTVPFDTNLKFSIQSRRLTLGDATQKALPSNASQQAFQHASPVAGGAASSLGAVGLGGPSGTLSSPAIGLATASPPDFSYSILSAKP